MKYLIISNMRIESRDKHEGLVKEFVDAVTIGLDSNDAVFGKRVGTVRQQADGSEDIGNYQRFEYVQFKVAVASTNSDSNVIAHNLRSNHRNGFTLRRVHFA